MSWFDDLRAWQGFFTLLGEATASFAGLLFVALAVNSERLRSSEKGHLPLLARQTFYNLMVLTTLSLMASVPKTTPDTIGGFVMLGCIGGLLTCYVGIKAEINARKKNPEAVRLLRAYFGPIFVFVLLLSSAVHMTAAQRDDLQLVGWGAIMLAVASARNAWLLLNLPAN